MKQCLWAYDNDILYIIIPLKHFLFYGIGNVEITVNQVDLLKYDLNGFYLYRYS